MSARRAAPKITNLGNIVDDELVPKAKEAEAATCGAILVMGRKAFARAKGIISETDAFVDARHVRLWESFEALDKRGSEIDTTLVTGELDRFGGLADAGGPAYIAALIEGVPHTGNVDHYAAQIAEAATKRRLMAHGIRLVQASANCHTLADLRHAGECLYREILSADPEARKRCAPTADVIVEYAKAADAPKGRRIKIGFADLDEATDGIAPGEVETVLARQQVGKSALLSQAHVNASLQGVPSVLFSLEMPRLQAFERMVQQRLGLTRAEVERAAKSEWAGLRPEQRAALDSLAGNTVIVDVGKSGIGDLDAAMVEATAILGKAPCLVSIDYLGLLGSGARNLPLYQRVSEAAIDCKSFAKRHNVAVLLACQASRSPDPKRTAGAAPLGIDAARDSGQVEEAADFLVNLWRPELEPGMHPEERAEVSGQLWVAVLKNRRGPRPTFRLSLHAETVTVADWPEER